MMRILINRFGFLVSWCRMRHGSRLVSRFRCIDRFLISWGRMRHRRRLVSRFRCLISWSWGRLIHWCWVLDQFGRSCGHMMRSRVILVLDVVEGQHVCVFLHVMAMHGEAKDHFHTKGMSVKVFGSLVLGFGVVRSRFRFVIGG